MSRKTNKKAAHHVEGVAKSEDFSGNIRKELKAYRNPLNLCLKKRGLSADRFFELLIHAKENGDNVEELIDPDRYNNTIMGFFSSSVKGDIKEISHVFKGIHLATILSPNYHRYVYMLEPFWKPIWDTDVLLQLPETQFVEGIMAFIAILIQVNFQEDFCKSSPYHIYVPEGEFYYIDELIDASILYKTFTRLYELQEKEYDMSQTSFKLDYKRIVTGYIDKNLIKECWSSKKSKPVDFLSLLLLGFSRRPRILRKLFLETPAMTFLMKTLESVSCKSMHPVVMLHVEMFLETSRTSKSLPPEVYTKHLKTLDYKLLMSISIDMSANFHVQRSAQRILLNIICHRDECAPLNKDMYFPPRKVFTSIEFYKLDDLFRSMDCIHRIFAFVIIGEMLEKEEIRDKIIQHRIPEVAVSTLRGMIDYGLDSDNVPRVVEGALVVLMRLAHANKDRQMKLINTGAIEITCKYMHHSIDKLRHLAKSAALNLSGRTFEGQLEVFKNINFKLLATAAHNFHVSFIDGFESKEQYLKLMHVDIALIRLELSVNHHLTKGNGADNSYLNITKGTGCKLMEIIWYCIMDNKKTLSPTFILLSIQSMIYLIHMQCIDLSKWFTPTMIAIVLEVTSDTNNSSFFSDCEKFENVMKQRYPNLSLKADDTKQKSKASGTDFGTKCSWPPCLNYGPSKETKSLGITRKALKKCGNCQQVAYCGATCQKLHWKDHKKDCKKVSTLI